MSDYIASFNMPHNIGDSLAFSDPDQYALANYQSVGHWQDNQAMSGLHAGGYKPNAFAGPSGGFDPGSSFLQNPSSNYDATCLLPSYDQATAANASELPTFVPSEGAGSATLSDSATMENFAYSVQNNYLSLPYHQTFGDAQTTFMPALGGHNVQGFPNGYPQGMSTDQTAYPVSHPSQASYHAASGAYVQPNGYGQPLAVPNNRAAHSEYKESLLFDASRSAGATGQYYGSFIHSQLPQTQFGFPLSLAPSPAPSSLTSSSLNPPSTSATSPSSMASSSLSPTLSNVYFEPCASSSEPQPQQKKKNSRVTKETRSQTKRTRSEQTMKYKLLLVGEDVQKGCHRVALYKCKGFKNGLPCTHLAVKGDMTRHISSHMREMEVGWYCSLCNERLSREDSLKRHVDAHTKPGDTRNAEAQSLLNNWNNDFANTRFGVLKDGVFQVCKKADVIREMMCVASITPIQKDD